MEKKNLSDIFSILKNSKKIRPVFPLDKLLRTLLIDFIKNS
jgi:hypothetical protein